LIIISVVDVYLFEIILIGVLWGFRSTIISSLPENTGNETTFMLFFCVLGSILVGIINYQVRVYGIYLLPLVLLIHS
jgi:hypothetical protein